MKIYVDIEALTQRLTKTQADAEELAKRIRKKSEDFYLGDGTGVEEYVGMAIELAHLGCRLSRVILEGPEEEWDFG